MGGDYVPKTDPIYENQQRQLSASSNLNPFAPNPESFNATASALVLLNGLQIVGTKSNVMMFAVGGIVSSSLLILT